MDADTQLRAAAPTATPKQNRRPPGTALDGRSREYRLLQRTRAELLGTLGHAPSVIEAALVEEAAWATVRLAQLHATAEAGVALSKTGLRQHTGLSNIKLRALSRLADAARPAAGSKAKGSAGRTSLADIIARHDAA